MKFRVLTSRPYVVLTCVLYLTCFRMSTILYKRILLCLRY